MPPFSKYRLYLAVAFSTALFMGGVLSIKIIDLVGHPVPGGAFLFPVTFSCLVIMAEVYGLPASWRLAQAGITALIVALLATFIVVHAPVGPFGDAESRRFDTLFSLNIADFGTVPFSFAMGEATGLLIYRYAALYGHGRLLWLRLTLVPMASQMVTSTVFMFIAYHGDFSHLGLALAIAGRVIFAALYATATAPLLWTLILAIRNHDQPRPVPLPPYPEGLR